MDEEIDARQRERQQSYKAGISAEDNRRKREETTVSIRKAKRSENLKRRRNLGGGNEDVELSYHQSDGKLEQLPAMLQALRNPDTQLEATQWFRKILSIENQPPIATVISTGVVPVFINFLSRSDAPLLQFEAAWALTNIASGDSEDTKTVIENGAVPELIALLTTATGEVRDQAVWCLGNIAGDSYECRNYLLRNNIIEPLLMNLNNPETPKPMMRTCTWVLSNLCRGKPQPDWAFVAPALQTLVVLIYHPDDDVLTDALWALSYLCDGPDDRIQQIIHAGVCPRAVELLSPDQPASIQLPALRAVGNIVTGNDTQTQVVLKCGVLPALYLLLQSPKPNIQKEACWTISNITAGSKAQIKAVIDSNLIPPLIYILGTSEYFKTKKEAAWAITNLCSGGTPDQIRYLVSERPIGPLCDLLLVSDPRVIQVAMEALDKILAVGKEDAKVLGYNPYAVMVDEAEGLEKLDTLQGHSNKEVYKKAMYLLESYFGEDQGDTGLQTTVNESGQFALGGGLAQGGFHFGS